MKKLLFAIVLLFISYSAIIAQGTLSATVEENDAFITLNWELPKQTCLTNNGTPYTDGVYIRLLVDGQEIYSESITDLTNIGTTYSQSYLHYVGPGASINYSLEVREIGIGSLLCGPPLFDTGSTTAFQPPAQFLASDQVKPDSIFLSWTNNSELATSYIILRDGKIIDAVNDIDSVNQVLTFEDVFVVGDSNSLKNGVAYTYEIQTEASGINQTYANGITDIGSTVPINLLATDGLNGEPQDMVKLSWNNMAAFCEEIRILRGSALIATVANNATDYMDDDPTFGEKIPYQVQLIKNGTIKVATIDTGFVAAIGSISGKVLTEKGSYPIDNARITLSYLTGDIAIYDTLYIDESGCFNLTGIKYGRGTQLELAVSKTDFEFENALDTIFLTNESSAFSELLFLADTEYPETTNTIDFSNLSIQSFDQSDYVQLNWEYVSDPTAITFFNIYRSGVLIARLSDKNGAVATTYVDKTGVPEVDYTYVINYFRIENGALIDSSNQVSQIFPAVTKVPSLTATFDNVGGKVDLTWTHPSTNFNGFYIYRNLELIDSLPNTAMSYTDFSGASTTNYTYKIAAYRTVGQVNFTSELTEAEMGIYPMLPPPLNPEVYNIEKASFVKLKWTIPSSLMTPNYNYSGFRVYRKLGNSIEDFALLGEIDKYFITGNTYEFSDFTGKSGFDYEYEVRTFVETAASFFEVSTNPLPFTYPEVSANITGTNTSAGNNFVGIQWTTEMIPVVNIDGYIISKGTVTDSIAALLYGESKFDYYITPNEYGQPLTFFVRSYRLVDGMLFYSTPTTIPVQHTTIKDDTPEIPTQVTATKDLAGLIKVCWEYPNFIQATFKVYRTPGLNGAGNELVAELTTTERAYYDYDANPGVRYEYEVVADYEGNESSPAKTSGKARQFNRLSGRIYSHQAGVGTPKVKVELVNAAENIILGSFFSDSTGYYLFENIQVPSGTNLTIRATGSNTDFEQTAGIQPMMEQAMTVATGVQNYEQDFINYFEPVLFPADTVQTPDYFIAAANYATMNVEITWSPKDDLYSGFIIYRGLTDNDVLGEVKRGERFQLVDDGGAPGYTYIYAIQAYLDTPTGRKFSLKTGTSMIYPMLLPVQHLMANEVRGANRVAVRWGHAFDNHDRYVVTRNEVPVAAIKAGAKMEYIDSTSVPGERYLYAVYAERKVKGLAYLSEVRTVELDYPDIARVEALSLQQYGTLPGRDCGFNPPPPIQSNRVKVDWTIDSTKVDGFEIYRNQTLIATVGNDSTYFIDNQSIPETANTYEVIAFVEREQLRFFSRALSETITLGTIPPPTNFQAAIQANKGRVELTWDYFSGEAEEFILSYINLVNNNEGEIGRVKGANTVNYSFLHNYHLPEDILYRITAVKKDDNTTYSSAEITVCSSVMFPKPPNIPEFSGTNKVGHTALTWTYDPEIAIDYFAMINNNSGGVEIIDKNQRSFDLVETSPGIVLLSACRQINGMTYCSDRFVLNIQPTSKSETQVIAKSGVQSIAVDGDILVIGMPNAKRFEYYENMTNNWQFRAGITDSPNSTRELGKSVAVEYPRIVVYDGRFLGFFDVSTDPTLSLAKSIPLFEGILPINPLFNIVSLQRRLYLAMDKGKLFTAAPIFSVTSHYLTTEYTEDYSFRETFKLDGGNYVQEHLKLYGESRDPLSVWDMAVDNGILVSGNIAHDGFRGGLGITKVSDLDSTLVLNALAGQPSGQFGSSVDISGDYAIGGSTFLNKVFIYKKDGTDWIGNATLAPPTGSNIQRYGQLVAIDGALAAVSVNNFSNSGVRIYKKDNNENWNFVKFFPMGPKSTGVEQTDMVMNDKFVFSSDISNFYIHSLLNAPEQLTVDATATSEVKLNWTYEELQIIDKFRIYRDGVEIGTAPRTNRTFSDTDGIPGKTYTYQVVAYAGEQESQYATIKGTRAADGKITGSVKTLTGQAPVSGATITLEGIAYADENETRIDRAIAMTTTTDGVGEFEFTGVYYGEFGANYTVLASYKDHIIKPVPNTNTPDLNSNTKQAGPINFFDEVGLAIVGQVRHADEAYSCGLDSIKVTVWSKVAGVDPLPKSVKTDKNGNYALAIDPNQQGLEKIYLTIENFRTSFGESMDTTFYNFKATAGTDTLFLAADFPTLMENEVTTVDFEQTITYPTLISLKNTCGDPINGEQFMVRIRHAGGCYNKTILLEPNGEFRVNLPPIDGLIITAFEAVNKTSIGSIVLDYLKFRPGTLNLLTAHNTYRKQLAQKTMLGLTDQEIVDNLTKNSSVKLTFHVTPTITVANFGEFVCAEIPHKLLQEDSIDVSFQISELQNGVNCAVREGYVVINNPAANATNKQLDTIYFDSELNGFPTYSFSAGAPNIVSPFSWGMELSYFTETGSFLKTMTIPIAIEGSSAVPGYDVIVDPDDEIIPYPLYILRDPPGDNSSTTLKAGKTFSTSISNSFTGSTGYKFGVSAGFGLFGVGGSTDIAVDVSGGGGREMTLNVTGTVTESISTGTGNKAIGEQGDIIVGMGVAYQYGLIENIEVVGCGDIRKSVEIGFTPSSVATKWVYTIDQIERIRDDNNRRVADIAKRPLAEQKEKEKERTVLANTAKNWDEVLIYHREKTLPHLVLCNLKYAEEVKGFPNYNFRVAAIAVWQEEFCQQYGQADLIWDDEAVNAYNNALSAIKELADNDNSLQELQVSLFDEDLWKTAEGYSDPIFDNQFGKAAENTTFSANTSITRSLSLARNSTTSQNGFASVGTNLSSAIKADAKLELVNGAWVGFGAGGSVATTLQLTNAQTSFSQELSFKFDYKHAKVNSVAESIDMSYTLSDDDTGDQHSVTVVQGVSPTHSPYFYRFGGRSSCPPEDGTIVRDDPKIQIIDPETGTAKKALQLYDQDPNQPVTLTVRVTNNNPFDEARFTTAYLDNATNGNGARLKFAGSILGEVDLFNKIPPGVPQDFILTLERNVAYQYDNIKVGVWASCGGPNQNFDEIDLSVHFQTPCSPVTIVSPNNNWVANGVDDTLVIKVRDYQPDNPVFERLKLQYRRVDVGDDWDDVNVNELLVDFGDFEIPGFDPPFSEQRNPTAEFLGEFNKRFIGTPSYPIIWAIPNNVVTYPDGKYEVRVMATCESSENPSNVISGTIDRSALRLLNAPEPSDGLWLKGDELKAAFNQNLDCALLSLTDNFDIMIVDKSANNAAVPFTPVCFNNELTFDLGTNDNFMDDFSVLEDYDGHTLEVIIAQATAAVSGNQLADTIRWEFDVVTQKLYWATDTINVELYADEFLNFSVDLIETPDIQDNLPIISLKAKDGTIDPWLNMEIPNVVGLVFDPDPAGKTISFTIDGRVGPGEVMEIIEVHDLNNGNKPTIVIKAKILNRAPDWTVNTAAYNETMNIIANWRFTDDVDTIQSIDTMDIISVWIDGTLRGTARLEFTGALGFYAAYLTIYGNAADANKGLEFRVWDGQPGVEYLAVELGAPLTYAKDEIIGSTNTPQILLVDREQSRIRYIPLKQGWTGFSLNLNKSDNSLNSLLSSLSKLTTGDIIKTQDKFATYETGIGWISSMGDAGLTMLEAAEGYQIFLQNGPDTLAITGLNASLSKTDSLTSGWNWIGVPFQEAKVIQEALVFIPPLANNSVLKTVNRITPNEVDLFLDYNNGVWSPPNKELLPYDFIKIKVNNAAGTVLSYDASVPFRSPETSEIAQGRGNPTADPNNQMTWQIGAESWEYSVPLVATMSFNGVISTNPNDQIAVFVGNDLRGVGNVEDLTGLENGVVSISIGATTIGENYDLYYYNSTQNKVYPIEVTLNFDTGNNAEASLGFGNYSTPYPLGLALFAINVQKQDVLCTADNTGFIEVTPTGAFSPTYEWSHSDNATTNKIENLIAGTYVVTITDTRNVPVIETIVIENQNATLTQPTISGNAPVCQGEALLLTASNSAFPNAAFNWYDEANNLILANNNQLSLNNLQQTQTVQAISVINEVCFSDAKSEVIVVNQSTTATFSTDTRTPAANSQVVTFTPSIQDNATNYLWDFGDGNMSTDMIAQHIYTTIGIYTVTLATTTASNCSASNISVNYMTVGESVNCSATNPMMNFTSLIPTDDYHAVTSITSTGQVMANTTVNFTAGESITLSPGFSAAANSAFSAQIVPCAAPLQSEETSARNVIPTLEKIASVTSLNISPNPSSGLTNLGFNLSEAGKISLAIFDSRGVLVKQLIREELYQQGDYQFQYRANHEAYGLYYVILQKDTEITKRKLIIVR